MSTQGIPGSTTSQKKLPLTNKQKKARKLSKMAKQSRKINYKKNKK
jgi:hypothetical protein